MNVQEIMTNVLINIVANAIMIISINGLILKLLLIQRS